MRKLSESVDRFIPTALVEAKALAHLQVEAMGAFLPQPPDYADPAELTSRLAELPAIALLPRHLDVVVHEGLVHQRRADQAALDRLAGSAHPDLARARRLIAAFLRGHASLPDSVDHELIAETATAERSAATVANPSPRPGAATDASSKDSGVVVNRLRRLSAVLSGLQALVSATRAKRPAVAAKTACASVRVHVNALVISSS